MATKECARGYTTAPHLGLALGKIKLKGVITAQICWFSHERRRAKEEEKPLTEKVKEVVGVK